MRRTPVLLTLGVAHWARVHLGPKPQGLACSGRARFIAWRLRCPFLKECRRGQRNFWSHQECLCATTLHISPTLKRPCATLWHGGMPNKYQDSSHFNFRLSPLGLNTLRPAVFRDKRFSLGVSRLLWMSVKAAWQRCVNKAICHTLAWWGHSSSRWSRPLDMHAGKT